jgi:hypothetical protein
VSDSPVRSIASDFARSRAAALRLESAGRICLGPVADLAVFLDWLGVLLDRLAVFAADVASDFERPLPAAETLDEVGGIFLGATRGGLVAVVSSLDWLAVPEVDLEAALDWLGVFLHWLGVLLGWLGVFAEDVAPDLECPLPAAETLDGVCRIFLGATKGDLAAVVSSLDWLGVPVAACVRLSASVLQQ